MSKLPSWKQKSLQRHFRYSFYNKTWNTFHQKSHTSWLWKNTSLMNFSAPYNVEKIICLNKIILRENILEDLFTHVEGINSITSFLSHHVPIWILVQHHTALFWGILVWTLSPWFQCHVYIQTARGKEFLVFIVLSVTRVVLTIQIYGKGQIF